MPLDPAASASDNPEKLYADAVDVHGGALERLARSYEADPDKRQDLLQEIYLENHDAATISEITGLSTGDVATKISRLKVLLGQQAKRGELHAR